MGSEEQWGQSIATDHGFLDGFEIIGLDARIAKKAVSLRRERRIKLPDAVIGPRRR
jgi:hypothetical protein